MPEHELETFRALPAWPARVAAAHTLVRELVAADTFQFDPSRFGRVAVPTLLLVGSDSPAYLRASTEAVAAALPDCRIRVLDGQQHVAMDTAPDLLADAVISFVTGS